jgi:hypothetical protein
MLDRRTWETCPIDCTESLGNIYGNRSQTCRSKDKTYRDAQLGELVHFIAVEHAGEKHEEGETVAEWQPPRASGYEATTSPWG